MFINILIKHIFAERMPALAIEHFQQNGNIKSITHIDESNNEVAMSGLDTSKKVLNDNNAEQQLAQAHQIHTEAISIPEEKEVVEVEIIPKKYSLIRFPKEKSCFRKVMWFVLWPIHFLFMLTIPDCERPSLKKFFPLTFIMCIVWIGSLSYMVAWMITIIGMCYVIDLIIK